MSRNICLKKQKPEWKLDKEINKQYPTRKPKSKLPHSFGMDVAPKTVSSFHYQKQPGVAGGFGKQQLKAKIFTSHPQV